MTNKDKPAATTWNDKRLGAVEINRRLDEAETKHRPKLVREYEENGVRIKVYDPR